ncbi:MAG: hypothetical protein ABSG87_10185 [Verrucomicrobiota bacterium]|jgi:hypothetical protein
MKLFEEESNLGEIEIVSAKYPKLVGVGRDVTGNPSINGHDNFYSPPGITFHCSHLIENQYFYQIQDITGRTRDILVKKIEPKDEGFVVSADFLPQ